MVNVPLSQQNSIELNTKYIASDIAKSILRDNYVQLKTIYTLTEPSTW